MSILASLQQALADGDIEVIDLTTPLADDTVILELPAQFANTRGLSVTEVSRYDDRGPAWAWNDLQVGEHAGTHLDAPVHWISGRDGKSVDQIEPGRLVGPIVVIDKTAEVAENPDFDLEPEHFEAWIAEHGPLPDNCWVLFRTGWSQYAHSRDTFLNADAEGPHTPGVSVAGAQWLASNPKVSGFGVETVGIDSGQAGTFDPVYPVHYFLLGADKYGLTSLVGLDRLPVTGAMISVSPLNVVGGTGAPARVFAYVER
ncbi:cyclase family protein [Gulosibacter macacae]|uniref:Cyclase family protein n=1 Tax=Gulosibacter macacae TaxID=2488791 RepID=A0A3P3VVL7_9MICO|nr:cyclase family protein [Gulosibacter macacae]RRJ86387.1 cyclase family protein [Gulosibacter macacae]